MSEWPCRKHVCLGLLIKPNQRPLASKTSKAPKVNAPQHEKARLHQLRSRVGTFTSRPAARAPANRLRQRPNLAAALRSFRPVASLKVFDNTSLMISHHDSLLSRSAAAALCSSPAPSAPSSGEGYHAPSARIRLHAINFPVSTTQTFRWTCPNFLEFRPRSRGSPSPQFARETSPNETIAVACSPTHGYCHRFQYTR